MLTTSPRASATPPSKMSTSLIRARRLLWLLLTFTTAVVAIVACEDVASPRPQAVGEAANRNIDSPDQVILVLPAADPWNGRAVTPVMTYGTYTLNTVVKITASGMHSRTPNYSILGGAISMGPSGNASVVVGASGISIVEGGSVSPTATVYANVIGNVTKGQRDGYSRSEADR